MKKIPAADMYEICPLMPFACPMCDACAFFSGGFQEACIADAGEKDERHGGEDA